MVGGFALGKSSENASLSSCKEWVIILRTYQINGFK